MLRINNYVKKNYYLCKNKIFKNTYPKEKELYLTEEGLEEIKKELEARGYSVDVRMKTALC